MKKLLDQDRAINSKILDTLNVAIPNEEETINVRIAGAQIPIHAGDIQYNKKEIFKALDWAKENEVDHILTPEGALSGYVNDWQDRIDELGEALSEIEKYQRRTGVGLHLGTMFREPENKGLVNRSQIRHYNKKGKLDAVSNKTWVLEIEGCLGRDNKHEGISGVPLSENHPAICTGMLCNDMWGFGEELHTVRKSQEYCLDLIMHATNGRKFLRDDPQWEIFDQWHTGFLRMTAYKTLTPILTVDSCVPWNWQGDEDTVDTYPTGSQTGVLEFDGWKTDVPRHGRQYFHYDLNIGLPVPIKFAEYYNETDKPFDLFVESKDGEMLLKSEINNISNVMNNGNF